ARPAATARPTAGQALVRGATVRVSRSPARGLSHRALIDDRRSQPNLDVARRGHRLAGRVHTLEPDPAVRRENAFAAHLDFVPVRARAAAVAADARQCGKQSDDAKGAVQAPLFPTFLGNVPRE